MKDEKPYWEMSRLTLDNLGKYDQLYKDQKQRLRTSATRRSQKRTEPQPYRYKPSTAMTRTTPPVVMTAETMQREREYPTDKIELVGYKPSEYKAYRPPTTLRGRTAPVEHGSRDIFKDFHTPIQITHKFQGAPILSVPIKRQKQPARSRSINTKRTRNLTDPITTILFEESVGQNEVIDPWGYAADEEVVIPEKTFHGIKLKVSHLARPQ